MNETAERLADSLLYEGYALYPYTPGATKNATPTPFGIVYPAAYAGAQPAAFDHAQIECVVLTEEAGDAEVEVAALFLQAAGSRHKAAQRRVEAGGRLGELAREPVEVAFAFEPSSAIGVTTGPDLEGAGEVISGTLRLSAELLAEGMARLTASISNTTPLPAAEAERMDRGAALQRSLLSTHLLAGVSPGHFASPLEDEGAAGAAVALCENVNSWPVLAAGDDSAVLGAAILLPDHPQIAAQSKANMFDNTEIEEALTLHVQTLSGSEREAIAADDPVVGEMIERVAGTTPDELLGMHGEMRPSDPGLGLSGASAPAPDFPQWSEPGAGGGEAPASAPAGLDPADVPGESEIVIDGRRFERGGKVILRPGSDGDPYDKMLDGQPATIRRIYLDYDGRAYLGVTVDADPMSEVMREAGRYLFFFADELESPGE